MDSFVQLFLEDCRKCADREDVDQRVIDFELLDMDFALFKFHIKLPPCFHKKTVEWRDNELTAENKEGGKGGKHKSDVKDDGKKNDGKKRAGGRAVNETQLNEFKMARLVFILCGTALYRTVPKKLFLVSHRTVRYN